MSKKTKTIITTILIIGAAVLLIIRSCSLIVPKESIGIIGGADGPTAIFVAGKVGNNLKGLWGGGILLVTIGIIVLIRKSRRNGKNEEEK